MKQITVTIGGITQDVNESDVSLYKRAGYEVVGSAPAPVDPIVPPAPITLVQDDTETLAKIAAVTDPSDLYAFQVEGRSQLVEDAINAKGTELMAALKAADEAAAEARKTAQTGAKG